MTRDMNETRAAKARISAVAGRLSLVATGLGALTLIAISAQMMLDHPGSTPAGSTPLAGMMRATDEPVTTAPAPRPMPAVASLGATAPAALLPDTGISPQIWYSALPDSLPPAASQDFDHSVMVARPMAGRSRAPATEAPQATIALAAYDPQDIARLATLRDPHETDLGSLVGGRRAEGSMVPAPAQRLFALDPQDTATTEAQDPAQPDAAVIARTETQALRASLMPRARPFVTAQAPEETPEAEEQAEALALAETPEAPAFENRGAPLTSPAPQRRPRIERALAEAPRDEAPVLLASLSGDATGSRTASDAPAALEIPALTGRSNDQCAGSMTRAMPGRSRNAEAGSTVIGRLTGSGGRERDDAITAEILRGNMPEFLRDLVPVSFDGTDARGRPTRITICVTPDYLSVGSNRDFVRVPLGLPAAMRIAERFDMVLPTTRMVDEIYRQAQVHLNPRPMDPTSAMVTTGYFLRHNATVQGQLQQAGARLGQLVSGHKKDLVLTNRLQSRPGQVAIYGWHQRNGRAIQPLSTVHGAQYADYSHGIRLVSRRAFVNGREVDLRDLLSNSQVAGLLSEEGTITNRQLLALAD